MPLVLKVQTELDESSLSDVTRTAHDVFDGLGRDLGPVLAQGLEYGLNGALRGATSELGAFGKAAESALSSIPAGAGAAALGIGGIVVAAAAAGKALYDLGATWDSITDSFTMATGRTGADLQAFADVVGDVGSMTAASLGDIGKVVEQLVQQFPQLDMGSESIRVMASDIATLNAAGQNINIHELGLAMRVFGVSAESGTKALDDFAAVARATGIPVSTIISEVRSGAPIFKQFGMDMGEASAYLAAFDSAGVDAGSTMTGLRAALIGLTGDSRGSREALQETITEIKRLYDAGEEHQAQQLAIETFGKRAFAPMLEAITSGALDLDTLNKALDGTVMSIQEMKDATDDGKESWQELGNTMQTRFKPIADIVFNAVNDGAMLLSGNLNKVQGGFEVTADKAAGLRDRLAEIVELQRQFQPDSPLGRMLLPGGVPGAPTQGGIGGPGGIGGSMGLGRDTGLGVNDGLGGFYPTPKPSGGSGGGGDLTPYGPGYGSGPMPGETAQQYSARMNQLEADHRVAEAEANLGKLRGSGTATAEQLQKAENDLAAARTRQQETALRNAEQANKPGGIDVAIPYAPDFGNGPNPGETTQQYSARTALLEAQHRSAEELAKLRQMESSGVATQNDIINQKNKVLEAQRAQQQAEMRLNDSYKEQVDKTTKGLDQLGNALDKDLGLSKGLPGLAENLVRFLGSLAAAPIQGMLGAVSAAQGGPSATGSGLVGMLAAGGAFGPDYMVGGYDQSGKPVSMTQMQAAGTSTPQYFSSPAAAQQSQQSQSSALQQQRTPYGLPAGSNIGGYGGGGVQFPDWVNKLGAMFGVSPSTYPGHQEGSGLNRGIDWSGPVPNMQRFAEYLGSIPGAMEQVIWENPNTKQKIGVAGGQPVGPGTNQPGYYRDDWGAHENHVHTRQSMSIPFPDMNYGGQPQLHDAGIGGPPLPPGTTVVQNNTGQNEHVVTPQQVTAISDFGKSMAPNPMSGTQAEKVGTGATQIGGAEPKAQQGGSAGGGGGLFGAAVGAGAMAADMFAPGSGAAVQIAGQEIQRAIKAGGQFAGIVGEGLMETFLPTGASEIANDNWLTRIAGGFVGLGPQLPNLAGKAPTPVPQQQAPAPPPLLPPVPADGGKNTGGPQNVTLNINGVSNVDESAARMLRDTTANTLQTANLGPGQR